MNTTTMDTHTRKRNKIERLVQNKWFWVVFCLFFFSYPILRSMNRTLPPELPKYFKVPEFKFQDENGAVFGSDELKGKLYISNFFFSSCPTTCPKLMETIQKVQKRVKGLGQGIALVSITVDPDYDSSKVLFKTAREYGANPYVWKFLRSDLASTKSLLTDGFKVPVGDRESLSENIYDIVHSGKLVLVDDEGYVRGYYETDKVSIDKLMIDVGLLVNRKKLNFKKES